MNCRLCDALAYNRQKPTTEPLNAVVQRGGLYVAPVSAGTATFERMVKGSMSVARLTAQSAPHAAATIVPTRCPDCGVALEGVLFECASYGAELETFLLDLRPFADAAKPAGVILFMPHWEGERRYQLVVWSHPEAGEGMVLADESPEGLGAWTQVPAAVAGAFWLSWDARKVARGFAKMFGGG